jgi:ABC-type multidrug transport system ATPase subunit
MVLSLHSVGRTYPGGRVALADLSASLTPGVVALLGPNGAGKSTLLRLMAALDRPSRGTILWRGTDIARHPDALRRELGYLPQDFGVYPQLTAREFLHLLAAAKRLPRRAARGRVDELLELVNLTDASRRPMGGYSGGMRQRVGIAQALLNDPGLLILDEPTVGLDPEERARFRHMLAGLAGERIIVLSTHVVSEVAALATRVVVLAAGSVRADERPERLIARAEGRVWEVVVPGSAAAGVARAHRLSEMTPVPGGVRLRLLAESMPAAGAVPVAPTLDDAYLLLLGRPPIAAAA